MTFTFTVYKNITRIISFKQSCLRKMCGELKIQKKK